MRRLVRLVGAFLFVALAGGGAQAVAQSTAAEAFTIVPDGSPRSGQVYGTASAWFVAHLAGGHSYIITAAEGEQRSTSHSGGFVSGLVTMELYQEDATTPVGGGPTTVRHDNNPAVRVTNAAIGGGSVAGGLRYSYTPAASGEIFLNLSPHYLTNASDWTSYRVSIIDTTLSCVWYYTSVDYDSYLEVHNSSDASVTLTAQFYGYPTGSGGTVSPVGDAVSYSLPALGTYVITAKGTAGVPAYSKGSIQITHNGVAGAIKGNVTTINTTGIGLTHSFNTACSPAFDHPSLLGVSY